MLSHSNLWVNFNYVCVFIAYVMLAASLVLIPVNIATKGYIAMGVIFLSGSLVTLVKTLHDLRVEREGFSRIERAKQDRLLQEYVANS